MNAPPSMPSGWFPDPHGRYDHRWFNGTAWTADVSAGGQRLVDPLGAAPDGRQGSFDGGGGTGNGMATAAITCGLIGMLLAWVPVVVVIGFVLAVLAVVFGVIGLKRSRQRGRGRGLAIAGVVTGVAGLLLSVLGVILTVSVIREVSDFVEPGPHDAQVVACTVEPGAVVVSATVTNLDDGERDYTLFAVIAEPDGVRDLVVEVDGVDPGETRDVELRRVIATAGECDARLVVHGPLPYGLDMERVND